MGDGILFLKNLYTRHLSLSMKTLHIKPILKAKKCGKSFSLSLLHFQYQAIHFIMICNFFGKITGFIVLLRDFRQEGGRLYNIFIFYSMKVLKANAYIRLRQACVCQGYGIYLTVKAS